jgi:K+-sensing histidine kinase KdpD
VESLIVPVDDHGTPIGTVWVASHGFERRFDRQDERTLQVLARFASAGWQLWHAYAAASETGRRKGDFLATLGLELRNPLAAIAGAVSILRLRTASDATSATHAIDVIARQTHQVSRVVYDLMDATRCANAKLELARQRVDLREVVAEPLEVLLAQPADRRHFMDRAEGRSDSVRRPPDSARSSRADSSRPRGQLHARQLPPTISTRRLT